MWNSIIAGGATGFTLAVRQGMAPALVSGGIGKVINRHHPQDPQAIFHGKLAKLRFFVTLHDDVIGTKTHHNRDQRLNFSLYTKFRASE